MIDPALAFNRLLQQEALGPRFAGSAGHKAAHELLSSWLLPADERRQQRFEAEFFGTRVECMNLCATFKGDQRGRVLLGSHFDTRPWADQESDVARQKEPVPGANDGASGVAVLAELAQELAVRRARPTVDIVFFDAEDWHDIDGHEVSLGARRFAQDLAPADRPDAAIIIDMVGGKDLVLDIDVGCQDHDPSYSLTLALFQMGRSLGLPCFSMKKDHPYKWVSDDHSPLRALGIASTVLIDMDYGPWHTLADTSAACDPASLGQIGAFLERFLFGLAPGE